MDNSFDFKSFECVKQQIYKLKTEYESLKVLPLTDMGENIYALTIGREEGSILLTGEFESAPFLIVWIYLLFLEDLLRAEKLSSLICNISPNKILENRSLTIIPNLYDENIPRDTRERVFVDLCRDWKITKTYFFGETKEPSKFLTYFSGSSPTYIMLIKELLATTFSFQKDIITDEKLIKLIKSIGEENYCFKILLKNEKSENLTLSDFFIKEKYEQLKEFLMLSLML